MSKNFFLAFFMVLIFTGFALGATSYTLGSSSTSDISEYGVCQRVTNSCGAGVFIPTKSSTEWSYFRSYKPSCIAVTSCTYSGTGCNACPSGSTQHVYSINSFYVSGSIIWRTCNFPSGVTQCRYYYPSSGWTSWSAYQSSCICNYQGTNYQWQIQ